MLETLSEHLDAYGAHLAQNFGSGVHLDSDIIHVHRPDGRDIDCILHVNPQLKHKGLAMVYNPLDRAVKKRLKLPLYYTGLAKTVSIRQQQGKNRKYELDRQYNIDIPVNMAPGSITWLVVE